MGFLNINCFGFEIVERSIWWEKEGAAAESKKPKGLAVPLALRFCFKLSWYMLSPIGESMYGFSRVRTAYQGMGVKGLIPKIINVNLKSSHNCINNGNMYFS
ncbi:MAG: hypothetical protein RBR67_03310 [Desulfobacterium sp.]|nr:hypothetical protein [Desulfobacterium sp.]